MFEFVLTAPIAFKHVNCCPFEFLCCFVFACERLCPFIRWRLKKERKVTKPHLVF